MSPLGRSRAGAGGRAGSRKARSSSARIHPWPIGVDTAVSDGASASNAAFAAPGFDPRPVRERVRSPRTEDVQVSAGELNPGIDGVGVGARHGPDRRCSGTVPADQDRARRRGIAERAGVNADPTSRRAVVHCPTAEELVEASGRVFGSPQGLGVVRQPPEREHGPILRRDHVGAESRPPQLHQRRVLPGGRSGPLDAGVDRQHRGPGHAVLQSRPRRPPQGPGAWREPLVECANPPPEREDLRPGEDETRRHFTPPTARRGRRLSIRAGALRGDAEDRPTGHGDASATLAGPANG